MNVLVSMRYLAALNEHRHFGRAAQACHITQPALSNALRALENEFGVLIVQRGRAFEGFTVEGEAVLATAQRMLHEQALLQEQLHSEAAHPRGRLRLAAVPAAMTLLSRFALALRACHPGIAPTVVSLSSLEIETALDGMSVDLALGYTDRTRVRNVRLAIWPQCTERYYLVQRAAGSAENEEAVRIGAPVGWAEAAQLPLCLLTPDMHNRAIVDQAFEMAGTPVSAAMETNSLHTLVRSVGALASVLPGAALELLVREHGPFEARPLVAPTLETPLGFMTHASERMSRALQAAVDLALSADWRAELASAVA
ncbi:LysR family transcriptional regulator [Variovorax boronicumulans]|uniref:LysR family transcriptional regulator n=1 Tax=Variovorax boronicumulans TaxID=436515 RepID=UPI001C561ACB